MRNFKSIDKYLDKLVQEVYPQPQDPGHTAWANESVEAFIHFTGELNGMSVLDLGCGEAFLQDTFERFGYDYEGVCLGEDFKVALSNNRTVHEVDFSFLHWWANESVDFLYSRHSLEHSPMPLLTLMEWHRVSKRYLGVVVPSPVHWTYVGRNHYYVLNDPQWRNLFDVAGFDVIYSHVKTHNMSPDPSGTEVEIEYWYLLEKKKPNPVVEIG